ncbi:hypothetical protein GPECTOR_3g106 [Gonium pectorale]|uniref:Strawberry notch AAA domain-containing protein n=1 Tax=Gonium pectorale TaxID=33097 RepID=A0A150GYE8_GONPE|nr:hypothetical protein GPECTOR_3g106 [Gonium pectorale]|eukprot:KXZ54936.1 hypothetical protein GPECTOR_3g106 [Gonium pectorale]
MAQGMSKNRAGKLAKATVQARMAAGHFGGNAAANPAGPHAVPARNPAINAAYPGMHVPRPAPAPPRRHHEEELQAREAEEANDAAEAEDEQGGHEDIYEQYRPVKVKDGSDHPDPIVETASLASVTPPDITYEHHLQEDVDNEQLSNAQLETVLYAFQRFNQRLSDGSRAGFFLGDGAGVGKGRQIAAVIKEFWATGGRRVLWVSTSTDLRFDARRDLSDLGADDIPVFPKGKDNLPTGSLHKALPSGGVVFITYSLLVSKGSYKPPPKSLRAESGGGAGRGAGGGGRGRGRGRRSAGGAYDAEEGDTAAEAALEAKREAARQLFGAGSRLHQLVTWLSGGESLIVLDECHKAKNLLDLAGNSSQTGLAVEALQEQVPDARVLYSSATGASEPNNLRYMVRLGSFGYASIGAMIDVLKDSGLGALEMFSMGLKATGTYLSRTLSYKGAEFRMEQLEMDPIFRVMYDRSVHLWNLIFKVMSQLPKDKRWKRDVRQSLFFSSHQRFYRQMLMASKVKRCAELAAEALNDGMCVVVGLQSTGEANLNSARELGGGGGRGGGGRAAGGDVANASEVGAEEMEDFVSAPKMVLYSFVAQWLFPKNVSEEEMSKKRRRKLQAEIYKVCKEWARVPSAAEEADRQMREAKRQAAAAARSAARAAAAATPAAAAAAAVSPAAALAVHVASAPKPEPVRGAYTATGSVKQASAAIEVLDDDSDVEIVAVVDIRQSKTAGASAGVKPEPAAAPMTAAARLTPGGGAGPAAAAAASTPAASELARGGHYVVDDDEDVVVEGERTIDDVLEEKRRRAMLAGDMIDLADADDGQTEQVLAQMAREEAERTAAVEKQRWEARQAQLVADLADAQEAAEAARLELQRLEREESGVPAGKDRTPSAAPAAAAAASSGRRRGGGSAVSGRSGLLDDDTVLEDGSDSDGGSEVTSPVRVRSGARRGMRGGRGSVRGKRSRTVEADDGSCEDADGEAAGTSTGAEPSSRGRKRLRQAVQQQQEVAPAEEMELADEVSDVELVGSAAACGDSERRGAAGAAGRSTANAGPPARGPVNAFKLRLEIRAARLRVKDAERALEVAQKAMNEFNAAAAAAAANGSAVGDAASSDDEDEPGGGARMAPHGANPALYRYAVKSNPLKNVSKSWAVQGRRGSESEVEGLTGEDDEDGDPSFAMNGDDDEDYDEAEEAEDDEEELENRPRPSSRSRRGAASSRGGSGSGQQAADEGYGPELAKCREMLLRLLDAQELPLNPLDQLTELLGGERCVAEMTGRKMLLVRNDQGKVVCKKRREDETQKMVNMAEKEDFMSGKKLVAIISDAASTGISLQADRRRVRQPHGAAGGLHHALRQFGVANQRRRFHITLELPWSADKAIQQFGRSHRSNQASAPIYCLLITKCGGEYRFAGAVAKRLTSLGALLRGDRRALGASTDLKPFDVDNKYGSQAVHRLLECVASHQHNVAGAAVPQLPEDQLPPAAAATPPGSHERVGAFLRSMALCLKAVGLLEESGGYFTVVGAKDARRGDKKSTSVPVPKFLNRLLGMPLGAQELLFKYFANIMDSLIKQARTAGTYEEGIMNIASSRATVALEDTIHTEAETGASTQYVEVDVDDGLSWGDATVALDAALADMRAENAPPEAMAKVGFYVARRKPNVGGTGHPLVILATALRRATVGGPRALEFRVQRPNQVRGFCFKQSELEEKYVKVNLEVAKRHWDFWYDFLDKGCLHGRGCERRRRTGCCDYGSRKYRLYLVSGAVLPLLRQLFDTVLTSDVGRDSKGHKPAPRVARVAMPEGGTIVGLSLLEQDAQSFLLRVTT